MLSENDMETVIIENPEKFIGEPGLKLVSRQHRIGNYIFDLLLQDRHGGKLIVEIQKGTLDRNHTYKILDYYHEYKTKNPEQFIELMIIANKIPRERQDRLRSWGVSFREISESEFESVLEERRKTHDRQETEPESKLPNVRTATPVVPVNQALPLKQTGHSLSGKRDDTREINRLASNDRCNELLHKLHERIVGIEPGIYMVPTSSYLAYRGARSNRNFFAVFVKNRDERLECHLLWSKEFSRLIPKLDTKRWASGNPLRPDEQYRFFLNCTRDADLDYALALIKKSYEFCQQSK